MTPSAPASGGPTTAPASPEGTAPFARLETTAHDAVRLAARDLAVGYDSVGEVGTATVVARGLDLELRAGELVCVLGPNGAGKSTLLRTLAGLQPPLEGTVEVDGRPLTNRHPRDLARRLAVVLTDRTVGGMMRGEELVRLGRHPHTPWTGRFGEDDRRAVRRALEAVDALHLADRPLSEISDGERQKITIARALAQEAEILVLDEVTAFLDLPRRVEILRLLRRLAHGEGPGEEAPRAVVLATHDLDLALRSADRLWLLSAEGELRSGLPESLVLDGSFETVFAGEGVDFDRRSGAFRMHRTRRGTVRLEASDDADGVVVEWTRRMLDRLGLVIGPTATGDAEDATITVGSGPEWILRGGGESRRYAALDGLAAALAAALSDGGEGGAVSSAASPERQSQSSPR